MKDEIEAKLRLHRKENPVYSKEIENCFNITGVQVRDIIRELRREGKPVANSKQGYYWARNEIELQETIEDLESRSFSMLKTIEGLRKAFKTKELSLF